MLIKKRVLVVDDEPGVLRFVNTSLSMAGYEVATTTSGEEAIELSQKTAFDVMLLDLLMFPITGFDVIKRLRTFSQMPVIVFTARNDIGYLALKEGACDFITKPFRPDEMVIKIGKIFSEVG